MSDFRHGANDQHGQVMPMTLVFIVAVILSLWIMYDSGSVMSDKIRLQNTADNVAYSSATLVSRDLNFIAYTNRGMVANQVAIAQMVGLSSWAASIEQLAANLNEIGQFIPFVNIATGGFETGATATSDALDLVAEFVIQLNDGVIQGLSTAQGVYHNSLIPQVGTLSQDIAEKNDPDAYALLSLGGASFAEASTLIGEWNEQIGDQYELKQVASGTSEDQLENSRYRDFETVVNQSRDPFSARRSYNWGDPFSGNLFFVRWQTRKYGGSEFFRTTDPGTGEYRWDWAAMETASMWIRFCDPFGCSSASELPLAWGAAHALDHDRSGDFHDYGLMDPERRRQALWGSGTWRNRGAATLLNASPVWSVSVGGKDHINHKIGEIRGLQEFYEFRSDDPIDSGPEVFAVYLKDENRISSQRSILTADGGVVAAEIDTQGAGGLNADRMGAVAKAQPYFARPTDLDGWRRGDNRIEYGNLYNPYWQPRLVDLTNAEKITAATIVGDGLSLSSAP